MVGEGMLIQKTHTRLLQMRSFTHVLSIFHWILRAICSPLKRWYALIRSIAFGDGNTGLLKHTERKARAHICYCYHNPICMFIFTERVPEYTSSFIQIWTLFFLSLLLVCMFNENGTLCITRNYLPRPLAPIRGQNNWWQWTLWEPAYPVEGAISLSYV